MPAAPGPKQASAKKNVPVKWRDSAWFPRVIIRSLEQPRAVGISDWQFAPEKLWPAGMPQLRRAGERFPGFGDARHFHHSRLAPCRLSRFFSNSSLDHLS